MGYAVDLSRAEPYELPSQPVAAVTEPARGTEHIDFGDDVLREPLVVVDRDGRIVRVIPR